MEKKTATDGPKLFAGLAAYRWALAPLAAILGVLFYAYTYSSLFPGIRWSMGLETVAPRFLSSLLFLGILPFVGSLLAGFKPSQMGLRRPRRFLDNRGFLTVWALLVGVSLLGSVDPELRAFYPFWKSYGSADLGGVQYLLYPLSYILFYYIPWEFCFRGAMLAPVLQDGMPDDSPSRRRVMGWALLSTASSALLHFAHPLSETLSAVLWGLLACAFTLRFGSILPAVLVHASVGIALDLALALGR